MVLLAGYPARESARWTRSIATRGLPSSSVKGGERGDARRNACLTGGFVRGAPAGASVVVAVGIAAGWGPGRAADTGPAPQPPTTRTAESTSRGRNRRKNTSGRYQSGPVVTSVSRWPPLRLAPALGLLQRDRQEVTQPPRGRTRSPARSCPQEPLA